MSGGRPQKPARPTRARLLEGEGELVLQAPGRALRTLGAPRRYVVAALLVWGAVIAAGLVLGWVLRGIA